MPRKQAKFANGLPKEPSALEALESLTSQEWRARRDGYECRVNHTHAKAIEAILSDYDIIVVLEVSEARSGRYIVLVTEAQGQAAINAALGEATRKN